jgi:hypothetical protein
MTEADWLSAPEPYGMLEFLRDSGKASDRKLRLFACACCRTVWDLLADPRGKTAVEAAEEFADGQMSGPQLEAVRQGVMAARAAHETTLQQRAGIVERVRNWWRGYTCDESEAGAAILAALMATHPDADRAARWAMGSALRSPQGDRDGRRMNSLSPDSQELQFYWAQRRLQAGMLRCVVGNPFQAAPTIESVVRSWNGGAVVHLATAAYDNRDLPSGTLDPASLAVLADALEEAGSTDAELLAHIRSPGPHMKGCWALDVILANQPRCHPRDPRRSSGRG